MDDRPHEGIDEPVDMQDEYCRVGNSHHYLTDYELSYRTDLEECNGFSESY